MIFDFNTLALFAAVTSLAFVLEVLLQDKWIRIMHGMKIEQVTKLYGPSWHEKTKMGTPEMGGVVFIPVLLVVAAIVMMATGISLITTVRIISYPILAAAVGFVDDWLKSSRHSSDGLKSKQKLLLQIVVTVPWAIWVASVQSELFPGCTIPPILFFILLSFTGVGLQNAVNVTDGLDGLAAGCSLISFFAACIFFIGNVPIALFLAGGCGICLGFLWHNANPASVFMGDVGAHFLAGLLLSACVNANAFIFVVPFGFFFGIEIFSVAIQIISLRYFKCRVFKMSPIHHHFEMSGWKETQIVVRFWIIHIIGVLLLTLLINFTVIRFYA